MHIVNVEQTIAAVAGTQWTDVVKTRPRTLCVPVAGLQAGGETRTVLSVMPCFRNCCKVEAIIHDPLT